MRKKVSRKQSDVVPSDALMTATDFSVATGCPAWRIRELQSSGEFMPRVQGRGRGNKSMYSFKQVVEYRLKYGDPPKDKEAPYTAHEAKECFQAFNDGKTQAYCVMEMSLHPEKVKTVHRVWQELMGAVTLSRKVVERINSLPLEGPIPIESEIDVHELLAKACSDPTPCEGCGEGTPTVCRKCYRAGKEAAAAAALQRVTTPDLPDEEPG